MKPGSSKLLIVLVIFVIACLIIVLKPKDTVSVPQNGVTTDQELQDQNKEIAVEIVEKVRKIIAIPEEIEPTVATIVDVDTLKERNPFYERAENGDYLVVTPDRAILYNAESNMILDVVPVQIQQAQ